MTDQHVNLIVNGEAQAVTVPSDAILVDVLREHLGLKGVRVGCRNGDCGTCTAYVDDDCVKTCLIFVGRADGQSVRTIESLGTVDDPSPVQQAFMECYSFQCGFCLPGMMLSATTLLDQQPTPSDAEIRDTLSGNLCRCTGYENFVRGVRRASQIMQQGD
ncbi:(2Fe-2S)-binding protein [Rhodococcus fascians]|uniref:(2Fe-2S)-binding protein n=1 Tax=Rhodococcoides fascians TaxID=1828 RepID=UPI001961416B|nr:(2Fe-2S)-binding protein [Rhodococcus fascians]MBM7244209.1 (2Fe-2S)-binding protein [Rhodococcus fascians]MBY3810435.1 (2Fe-2S)-binding protein [Rhodococcus fascians]MBY3841942.1 (2Fe-2S)-binding protein [Rhodococcus fascians]MBY3844393.1 (2Fe-2S)-binding protein [Rhodococcus fascians]MBY3850339.1 (2Fe-2S)-binding protein [Rhodococcus fascians]